MSKKLFLLFAILVLGSLTVTGIGLFHATAQDMPQPTAAERQRLTDLHRQLAAFKSELTAAGKYSCCLQESCDFCGLAAAMCPCGMKLQNNEAVCGECKMGWQAGNGRLPNVRASDVQALPDDMAKMMIDMRNMNKSAR